LFGRACAVRASLRHVPTCGGEAESHAEAALLRLIEALIQRFLGIGQEPQVRRPDGQRIGATAQTLGRIGTLPGSASCLAPRDPLLADVTERLLDRGPVLLLGGRQLQRGLDCRDVRIGNAAMSSAVSCARCDRSAGAGCWAEASVVPAIVSKSPACPALV
jgi:hypothetical protein